MNGNAVSYTHFVCSDISLEIIKAERGDCRGQTAFEFFTLFVVAVTYNDVLSDTGALIRGDNLGALNGALSLDSTAPAMNCISRGLAWRRIVNGWQHKLKHLPAEMNDEADALSRLKAVPQRLFPISALQGSKFVRPPKQDMLLWPARLVL